MRPVQGIVLVDVGTSHTDTHSTPHTLSLALELSLPLSPHAYLPLPRGRGLSCHTHDETDHPPTHALSQALVAREVGEEGNLLLQGDPQGPAHDVGAGRVASNDGK